MEPHLILFGKKSHYTDTCGARVFLDNRHPQKLYMKK